MFQRVCVKIVLYLLLFSVIIPSLNVKMTCCAVFGCSNDSKQGKEHTYHKFPSDKTLKSSLVTSNGADNHYTTLIQLVSRKYLRLRIKNILKDHAREKAFGKPCGNDLHRRRMLYHD